MSVAFVNYAETHFDDTTNVTSVSLSTLTISAGTNLALIAKIVQYHGALPSGFTVKWGSQTMQLIETYVDSTDGYAATIWGLVNPATGNQTLTASWTTATTEHGYIAGEVYSGVDQTGGATSFYGASTANSTGTSTSFTMSSATGDMVTALGSNASGGFTGVSSPATTVWTDGASFNNGASGYTAGASSTTITFNSGSSQLNYIGGFGLKAAASVVDDPTTRHDANLDVSPEWPQELGAEHAESIAVDSFGVPLGPADLVQAILAFSEEIWLPLPLGHTEPQPTPTEYWLIRSVLSFFDQADLVTSGHNEGLPTEDVDSVSALQVALDILESVYDEDARSSDHVEPSVDQFINIFVARALLSFLDLVPEPGLDHLEPIPTDDMVVVSQAVLVQSVLSFLDAAWSGEGNDHIEPRLLDRSVAAMTAKALVALTGRSGTVARASVAASIKTTTAAKASVTGKINTAGRATITVQSIGRGIGAMFIGGQTSARVKAAASVLPATVLSAVTTIKIMMRGRAVGKTPMAGWSAVHVMATPGIRGIAPIAGRAFASVAGRGGVVNDIILSGRSMIAGAARGGVRGAVVLAASADIAVRAKASMLARALMKGLTSVHVSGSAIAVGRLLSKLVGRAHIAIAGRAKVALGLSMAAAGNVAVQMRAATTGKTALAAATRVTAAGQGPLSAITKLAAATASIMAGHAGMVQPPVISFVQAKKNYNFTGSNITSLGVMLSAAVGFGDCIVVAVTVFPNTNTISVTDDKNNTYTALTTTNDTSDGEIATLFVCGDITNGPQTITASCGGASFSYAQIAAIEYSGVVGVADPADGASSQLQGGMIAGANALGSGSFSTTKNGNTIVTVAINEGGTDLTMSAGSGETLRLNDNGGGRTIAIADQSQVTSGSIQGTMTLAGSGTGNYVTLAVALKIASVNGGAAVFLAAASSVITHSLAVISGRVSMHASTVSASQAKSSASVTVLMAARSRVAVVSRAAGNAVMEFSGATQIAVALRVAMKTFRSSWRFVRPGRRSTAAGGGQRLVQPPSRNSTTKGSG